MVLEYKTWNNQFYRVNYEIINNYSIFTTT